MPLQKDWLFLKKKKSYVFRNWEYREIFILRLLCFILAPSRHQPIFNPFECLKLAGNLTHPTPTLFLITENTVFFSLSDETRWLPKPDCAFHFLTRVEFDICGTVD